MKLRKILTPILATTGTVAATVPLVCLTSCANEAEEKEIFLVEASAKTKSVATAETATWTIDAKTTVTIPSDMKVRAYLTKVDSNVEIVQCISKIDGTTLHVNIGYCTQEVSVKETTTFTTEFKLIFEWTETVGKDKKSYQQTINGFKLNYTVSI